MLSDEKCTLFDKNGTELNGTLWLDSSTHSINYKPTFGVEMEGESDWKISQYDSNIDLFAIKSISKSKSSEAKDEDMGALIMHLDIRRNKQKIRSNDIPTQIVRDRDEELETLRFRVDRTIFETILNELKAIRILEKVSSDSYTLGDKAVEQERQRNLMGGFSAREKLKSKQTGSFSTNIYESFARAGMMVDDLMSDLLTIKPTSRQSENHRSVIRDNRPTIGESSQRLGSRGTAKNAKFDESDFQLLKSCQSSYMKRSLHRKLFLDSASDDLRPQIWLYLLNINDIASIESDYKAQMDKLEAISSQGTNEDDPYHKYFELIDKDCERTDRNLDIFVPEENIDSLKRILKCFLIQNIKCGYYQGMNDIIAIIFSLYIEQYSENRVRLEAVCSAVFTAIFDRFLRVYTAENATELQLAFGHITYVLYTMDSRLLDQINEKNVNCFVFCLPWILLMFKRVYSDYHFVYQLWDSLLCGYFLESGSPNIVCQNILVVYCAVLLSQMRKEYFEAEEFGEEVAAEFLHRQNAVHNCAAIHPLLLSRKVADLYETHWLWGCKSDIFPLIFDILQ